MVAYVKRQQTLDISPFFAGSYEPFKSSFPIQIDHLGDSFAEIFKTSITSSAQLPAEPFSIKKSTTSNFLLLKTTLSISGSIIFTHKTRSNFFIRIPEHGPSQAIELPLKFSLPQVA